MVHIPIKIEGSKAAFWKQEYIPSAAGIFILGLILGVLATSISPYLRNTNARDQLAGVAQSQAGESSTEDSGQSPTQNIPTPVTDGGARDLNVDATPLDATSPTPAAPILTPGEMRASINTIISENTDIVDRLSKEMLHIKNDSVRLISEFDQNCGNWNDECALPYKDALNKNNAAYDELVTSINARNQDIDAARALLVSAP